MPYIVTGRIQHNGEVFEPGAKFAPEEITEPQIGALLEAGAIEEQAPPKRRGRPP